mgnify:CR=1 FL=1|tara:strand:+ start:46 stop:339 length:294 start_codon:yes stop_codon:yes gene_type:complete
MKSIKLLITSCLILLLLVFISCGRTLTHNDLEDRKKTLVHKLDKYESYELCELWDQTYTSSNVTDLISKKGAKQDRIEISKALIRKGEDPLLCRKKG